MRSRLAFLELPNVVCMSVVGLEVGVDGCVLVWVCCVGVDRCVLVWV